MGWIGFFASPIFWASESVTGFTGQTYLASELATGFTGQIYLASQLATRFLKNQSQNHSQKMNPQTILRNPIKPTREVHSCILRCDF